jgi:hypothetical protein
MKRIEECYMYIESSMMKLTKHFETRGEGVIGNIREWVNFSEYTVHVYRITKMRLLHIINVY